ncbi:MAG: type 1 glutamine amidotransferase-like domain-containing protein [Woeseia sp.]|nr:type 1 glutamine amidotransferase-like domain-containing protein [Woeseia sp.]NNL55184.1 type 1 glutamine amidotransferase-like domain-containing protein [Woeseia sp.]
MIKRLLLGPQRPVINLAEAVDAAGIPNDDVAVISAGWQEAEGDTDDVQQLVKRPLHDLQLYQRAANVMALDEKLATAYRQRQDRLMELQRIYQLRLKRLMMAARETMRFNADRDLVVAESRHAVSQLRALDRHHLHRVQSLYAEFESEFSRQTSEQLAEHAAEIEQVLARCPTVLLTGGNVIVLLNRLRLFGVHRLLDQHHLIAWSAGAMVLGDLIVLYHDRTPQGRRDPEAIAPGCCVLPGYAFFPDASRRLKLNDAIRVDLMSRRFSPGVCVTLDSGSRIEFDDNRLAAGSTARQLKKGGRITKLRAA